MGTQLIARNKRDRSWWLMIGLFTVCVVGWSLVFSLKVSAEQPQAGMAQIEQSEAEHSFDAVVQIRARQ